ncbi:hypothetical protein PYCC9005_005512 [Savitreella phatthalungensis]
MLRRLVKEHQERRALREFCRTFDRAKVTNTMPDTICFSHTQQVVSYKVVLAITEEFDGKLVLRPSLYVEWLVPWRERPAKVHLHLAFDKEIQSVNVVYPTAGSTGRPDAAPKQSTAGPFKYQGNDASDSSSILRKYCSAPCAPINSETRVDCNVYRGTFVPNPDSGLLFIELYRSDDDSADHWCCQYRFRGPGLSGGGYELPPIRMSPALAQQLLMSDPAVTWTISAELFIMTFQYTIPIEYETPRLFFASVHGGDVVPPASRFNGQMPKLVGALTDYHESFVTPTPPDGEVGEPFRIGETFAWQILGERQAAV